MVVDMGHGVVGSTVICLRDTRRTTDRGDGRVFSGGTERMSSSSETVRGVRENAVTKGGEMT